MSEHGQRLNYNNGCRCQACRDAAARYERGRQWDLIQGKPRSVPIIGPRRRMQALFAIGYDFADQGARLGVSAELVRAWATSRTFMYRRTAERIASLYDDLAYTTPPTETTAQKGKVVKAKNLAARRGWAVPMAWDDQDIDDPAAKPYVGRQRGNYAAEELAAEWRFLSSCGVSLEHAAKQLGVRPAAIEKALSRVAERGAA